MSALSVLQVAIIGKTAMVEVSLRLICFYMYLQSHFVPVSVPEPGVHIDGTVSCFIYVTAMKSLLPLLNPNRLRVFSRHDIIAVLFCSTHKSLTLGIKMLKFNLLHDSGA